MIMEYLSKKRNKIKDRIAGNGGEYGWNDEAGAMKTLNFNGYLRPLPVPAPGTNNDCPQQGATMAFYNDSATTAFVSFSEQDGTVVAAAAGTGLPVPPYSYVYFTVPVNSAGFDVSAATVYAFVVEDSTHL